MSFQALALICAVGILGPVLALTKRTRLPVLLGELIAGILLGPTGVNVLHAQNGEFTFLANIGFALIMFVAGSHVPVRDKRLRDGALIGAARAAFVGVLAVGLGVILARAFHTGHAALYAVLLASSSAALVLPIVDSLRLGGEPILRMLSQVAIADTACIVALPLAIDSAHAGRAALGTLAVVASAAVVYVAFRYIERTGIRRRAHRISERRKFALELRFNLAILFALAALAKNLQVSIMLAGFSFGLVVSAVGEPRRLARQLFAITEGFFSPLFFIWIGSSLDLRSLGSHPSDIALGAALGFGAIVTHAAMRSTGQPVSTGVLASGQLGVPVAAIAIGTQLHLLQRGESAAIVLGALITVAAAIVAAGRTAASN